MKGEVITANTKMKPSVWLDKKEVPDVEGYDVGDKVVITIVGKVISKNERKDKQGEDCSISVEYGKGDCELSDDVGQEAERRGLKRKDWKEIIKKRGKKESE